MGMEEVMAVATANKYGEIMTWEEAVKDAYERGIVDERQKWLKQAVTTTEAEIHAKCVRMLDAAGFIEASIWLDVHKL